MCCCEYHWNRSAACTCNCPEHSLRRAMGSPPNHRADRHEDSCSLACEAGCEPGSKCSTYVGTHRAEPTA